MTRERGSSDDTGMPVYPRLPVKPPQRDSEVKLGVASSGINRKLALMIAGALIFGGILGFLLRPRLTTDPKVAEMSTKLADAEKASGTQKQRADGLDKELDTMRAAKIAAEKKLLDAEGQISSKASELEKATTEAKTAQEKLLKTFDKSAGSIDVQDGELHVGINTSSLFAPNSADLTPAGKAILDKVAATLKDIPEKQFLILGHTDDSPPPVQSTAAPRPPPAPAPAKGGAAGKKPAAPAKPAAPPPPPSPPTIRFVTNWELSAARALAVLHYLQDRARIDPRRLQAVALGQYHPISRSNRVLNRRVEIVVRKG